MPEPIVPAVPPAPDVPSVDADEAALDASIDADIARIRADQPGAANPPEKPADAPAQPGEGAVSPTAGDTPTQDGAQPNDKPTPVEIALRAPVKAVGESDVAFQQRQRLHELVKQKKAATTPQEKDSIQAQMNEIREGFKHLGQVITRPSQTGNAPGDQQPAEAGADPADPVTPPEDLDTILERKRIEWQSDMEIKNSVESFFGSHPEFTDPDIKGVFTDFFDANYKIDGKDAVGVKEVLALAYDAMFKPDESIQERVVQGAGVQKKVDLMQSPGGTVPQQGLTPEQQASVEEMVATGKISREKAIELVT